MSKGLTCLLLLAAVLGAAHAARELEGSAGRELLQTHRLL